MRRVILSAVLLIGACESVPPTETPLASPSSTIPAAPPELGDWAGPLASSGWEPAQVERFSAMLLAIDELSRTMSGVIKKVIMKEVEAGRFPSAMVMLKAEVGFSVRSWVNDPQNGVSASDREGMIELVRSRRYEAALARAVELKGQS